MDHAISRVFNDPHWCLFDPKSLLYVALLVSDFWQIFRSLGLIYSWIHWIRYSYRLFPYHNCYFLALLQTLIFCHFVHNCRSHYCLHSHRLQSIWLKIANKCKLILFIKFYKFEKNLFQYFYPFFAFFMINYIQIEI